MLCSRLGSMHSFGKYEVLEKVGVGGFGVVWKAFDPHIKRTVAVKTCTSDDQEVRDRFFQEAEIAGNLQHRNVVTVYDFGVQEGVPYLVQEFLNGEDLDKKIERRQPIEPFERVAYLVQAARGMEFAHSKGVVHRDIKPANIRVLEDGTAKILDFGIAKLAQRHTGLTQTGMTLGTAQYLAPEQIRGEAIDPRTDIFSFGVLAFELLTYHKAFEGETLSNVIYQILHKEPPQLSEFWADAPAEAQELLNRCLDKDPKRRYPTTQDLVAALEHLARGLRAVALGNRDIESATSGAPTRALPLGDVLESTLSWGQSPKIDFPSRGRGGAGPRPLAKAEPERPRRLGWLVAALLSTAAIAAAGWGLREGWFAGSSSPAHPVTSAAKPPANPGGTQVGAARPSVPPSPSAPPSGSAGTTPAAQAAPTASGQPGPGSIAPATPATPAPTAPPAPVAPPAPPPPSKGTLLVAAAWDPRVTVSVDGGSPRRLDGVVRLALEPGEHTLRWAVDLGGFRDTATSRVTVRSDATTAADIPLRPPSRLTVQAGLASPRGAIRLDGVDIGESPIRARPVKAGEHRLEIFAPRAEGGAAAPPIVETLVLHSDTQTTVTFDLTRGAITSVHEKPSETPR